MKASSVTPVIIVASSVKMVSSFMVMVISAKMTPIIPAISSIRKKVAGWTGWIGITVRGKVRIDRTPITPIPGATSKRPTNHNEHDTHQKFLFHKMPPFRCFGCESFIKNLLSAPFLFEFIQFLKNRQFSSIS